jgi:hypothetical protein
MQQNPSHKSNLPVALVLGLGASVLSVFVFLGWVKYGSSIFMAAGEAALSWCF